MNTETEIGGIKFRTAKLSPKVQFNVLKRLMPLMARVPEASGGLKKEATLADLFSSTVMADAISHMDDKDSDFVIDACLSVVQREQVLEGSQQAVWAPVTTGKGVLMFADIDMNVMLKITVLVISENLGGFFGGAGPSPAAP